MTWARKTGHLTPWVKGQSGNPSGKPKGLITQPQIQELAVRMFTKSRDELKEVLDNPKATAGEVMFARMILSNSEKPDAALGTFFLDRMVGKVKEEHVLTAKPVDTDALLDEIPRDKLLALLNAATE